MRTATAQQQTDLASLDRQELVKLQIEDHAATLQDYTVAGGGTFEWLNEARLSINQNAIASTAQVTLDRELIQASQTFTVVASTDTFTATGHGLSNGDRVHIAGTNLAEATRWYVVGSTANTFQVSATSGGAAADVTADGSGKVSAWESLAPGVNDNDPLDVGRQIVISVAVIDQAASVTGSDWVKVFDGYVDDLDWGGAESRVTLACRDKAGILLDAWIESEASYGNTGSPVAQETVMQSLLTDTLGVGAPTLQVPTSPSFGIVEYTQRIQSLADALQAHADLIGWDLRYKWNTGSSAFLLTYEEPDRAKTVPDFTFDADDYFTVHNVAKSTQAVRNVCKIEWKDGSYVTVEDTASIAEYQDLRRVMFLDATQDPQINDATKATNLATAAVTDTAQPLIQKRVEGPLDWRFELGDLIRWTANSVHYSSDLDMAVTGLEHVLSPQDNTTTYYVRGQPTGGTLRWFRKESRRKTASNVTEIVPPSLPTGQVGASFDASGNLSGTAAGDGSVASWKIVGAIGSLPTRATAQAATAIDDAELDEVDVGTLAGPATAGQVGYVAAIPYSASGGAGAEGPLLWDVARFGTTSGGIPDDAVTSDKIADGAVVAAKITNQAQQWTTDVGFTTNTTTVSWTSGTMSLANGTNTAINAGSDTVPAGGGVMYVYYNGTATLQTTTTYSTVTSSESNILMAVTQRYAGSTLDAFLVPGVGALNKTGMKINADQIAANSISAALINVASLSAISANIGTVTAGTIESNVVLASGNLTASQVTADGTLVVKAGGADPNYALTVLSSTNPSSPYGILLHDGNLIASDSDFGFTFAGSVAGAALPGFNLIFATENLNVVDAGSTAATEQDWIQVEVGGNTGYIRVYATK